MSDERHEHPDSEPVVQTRYVSGEPASEAVTRALAAVEGVEPTELDLLYESVDLEALDALLGDPVVDENPPVVVEFAASGYQVVVRSDGLITVLEEPDE